MPLTSTRHSVHVIQPYTGTTADGSPQNQVLLGDGILGKNWPGSERVKIT